MCSVQLNVFLFPSVLVHVLLCFPPIKSVGTYLFVPHYFDYDSLTLGINLT